MKMPKKITIAGHEVSISLIKGGDRFSTAGDYSPWENSIQINTNGTVESVRAESLFHEIIEAIDVENELKLEHHKICTLSSQLFAIIRNNKLDFRK